MTEPICECGRTAVLVGGDHVYLHRPDLYAKRFWVCDPCDARVGCHPGTETPLGQKLAGPRLRALRLHAHFLLDPLWQTAEQWYADLPPHKVKTVRSIARRRIYRWLALQLGKPEEDCHIGGSDEPTCRAIIAALQGVTYGKIRKDLA